MGMSFSIRAQTPHLLFRVKLGERVEFYCNGKELRAAPRQKPRMCVGAACSMHCAFIGHKFLARNHLLASLLLSAGRWDAAAVRASWLRAEKNAWCYALSTAPPFCCWIAVAQGVVAAAGPQFIIQVHYGLDLYDGTSWCWGKGR
jgi:hypothetical protein